jgi:(R,R)-butanediol dehydrogenase/meso-butanediol dehydrogenase/diacetyl reductase
VQDIVPHQKERALAMGATDFIVDPRIGRRLGPGRKGQVASYECVGVPGRSPRRRAGAQQGHGADPGAVRSPAVRALRSAVEVRLQTSAFFSCGVQAPSTPGCRRGATRLLVTDTVSLEQLPASFEALKQRTHHCKILIAP